MKLKIEVKIESLIHKFWQWLAHRLPSNLIYFVGIRLWVHATTGKWADTDITKVTGEELVDRWGLRIDRLGL